MQELQEMKKSLEGRSDDDLTPEEKRALGERLAAFPLSIASGIRGCRPQRPGPPEWGIGVVCKNCGAPIYFNWTTDYPPIGDGQG